MDQQELFANLDAALKAEEHAQALELCDQILAAAPGDVDALHAKVVSLIELSKATEALQVVEVAEANSRIWTGKAEASSSQSRV